MKRKICVYTSTRAEYGLLRSVMQEIQVAGTLQLQILASGMHLSPEFGMTIQEIRADGFEPDETIDILLSSDTPTAICKSMGLAMIGYGEAIERLKPDMMLLLGDRFETFCMAAAAQVCRVPIAHIHGGELTEGAIDDAFRYFITNMIFLHFASSMEYRKRIIQLVESADRVFNVGALAVDNIVSLKFRPRKELENEFNFSFEPRTVLVTFHPATLDNEGSAVQFGELLKALNKFPDLRVIFTLPNADPNGRTIIKLINEYVRNNPDKACSFASLGRLNYLSVLNQVDVIVGNSSSGIIEAPSLGKPTVNIGLRQKGRIMGASVINCHPRKSSVYAALKKAFSKDFIKSCRRIRNFYGDGRAAEKILRIIIRNINNIQSTRKVFKDIPDI